MGREACLSGGRTEEELERVSKVVLVAHVELLDDELRVEHHEAAEDEEAQVEGHVGEQRGAEEDVGDADPEQEAEARGQEAAEVEHRPALREQGARREAAKDGEGANERVHEDAVVLRR